MVAVRSSDRSPAPSRSRRRGTPRRRGRSPCRSRGRSRSRTCARLAELQHRVVGADAVAVVAREAVAAGQAAPRLEQRVGLVEPARRPRRRSSARRAISSCGLHGARRVRVVPGVEHVEGGELVLGRRPVRVAAQPARRCGARPSCRGRRRPSRCARPGTMSPPAKIPGWPVIMFGPTFTTPSSTSIPGTPSSSERSASWPSASTSESASSSSSSPVGCGKPGLVELHLLEHELALVGLLDRREPLHHHALLLAPPRPRSRARASARACAGRRRSPPRRPSRLAVRADVHRGVAAAVDDHAPAQHRLLLALHAAQHARRRRGCAPPRRRGCRRAWRCARRPPGTRVEAALAHRLEDVGRPCGSAPARRPCRGSAATSASSTSRGSRYFGMPKRIMPPAIGPGSWIVDLVAEPRRGGRRPTAPTGPAPTTSTRLPARLGAATSTRPALLDRLVAEEPLDRVDPDRLVELAAVAGGLAGVVADPPHDRRERVVLHDLPPRALVASPPSSAW